MVKEYTTDRDVGRSLWVTSNDLSYRACWNTHCGCHAVSHHPQACANSNSSTIICVERTYLPMLYYTTGTICVSVCVPMFLLQLTLAHGSGETVGALLATPRFSFDLFLSAFLSFRANFFNFARSTLDIASGSLFRIAPAANAVHGPSCLIRCKLLDSDV